MFASLSRNAVLAGIVLFAPLMNVVAADAPPSVTAEQRRIDEAVAAYAKKLQTDENAAFDQRIAGRASALLEDSASPIIGDKNGDVAVVEFFDYACPYCKALEPRLEKLLKDDKRVKLILKEFPILTPESLVAARVSLAAAKQGKYEPFHVALMAYKGQLENSVIFDVAKDVGLDLPRLRRDMDSPEVSDQIIANLNLARGLHISGTPGFVVGGHFLTMPSAEIDFPKLAAQTRQASQRKAP